MWQSMTSRESACGALSRPGVFHFPTGNGQAIPRGCRKASAIRHVVPHGDPLLLPLSTEKRAGWRAPCGLRLPAAGATAPSCGYQQRAVDIMDSVENSA